ncbi:Dehydrogenases with different specificities (related to short-chain alcohol dehydrogenases) [Amycolatopsis camponoti]|uniref:Dehydrogenases with different specificities (Related to short-chain alcohol dehydrogenases) n=1 Tax=Amycolatopsis camponoti TaxID=2606593 RepID=A0A6I8LNW7_9PSEU|nr:SDR family oxidoreductase [Amycolatopsis camponoti]VVJ18710.1 Dehydrogenases with different specificities (related to short-chain alcohol dehydrogenases) [Amycolatopsis camponoti]
MERLRDRRILVTGAGSGIGRATTFRLMDEGAWVIGTDVSEEGLIETQKAAPRGGLTTYVMDVADEESVAFGVRSAVDALGGLDVVVNAAGILLASHTHETSLELWNRVLAVNLTGTFLVTRAALPSLLESENGVVVNFSSTSASFAHPYMAAYCASKGGIQAFTHSLALEYSKQGLRAVSIAPGSVKSGITDSALSWLPQNIDVSLFARLLPILPTDHTTEVGNPVADPETVAGVVAMLASDDGRFITGTEIRIDGGTHT